MAEQGIKHERLAVLELEGFVQQCLLFKSLLGFLNMD
jgi:hypothetical protein